MSEELANLVRDLAGQRIFLETVGVVAVRMEAMVYLVVALAQETLFT
jgi:hypothetical protein